jgi:2-isopropylmalate synthase
MQIQALNLREFMAELQRQLSGHHEVHLTDFKVRILDPEAATAAKTRVLIESQLHGDSWSTIGVSQNMIEASGEALRDALELPLIRAASALSKS